MLVLKNGGRVMAEGGKTLGNNEVNALRIENTDRISIGFVTTGPIAISWGDGTTQNLATQTVRYNASKLYASVGNWSIVITNPENVKEIYLDNGAGYGNVNKINTSVSWFSQFINLDFISINNAKFIGDLASTIDKMASLVKIVINITVPNLLSLNLSNCKKFWNRCLYVEVYDYVGSVTGSYADVNIGINCYKIGFRTNCSGDLSGIIKNGYNSLTSIGVTGANLVFPFTNIDDLVLPSSLTAIGPLNGFKNNCGNLINFNFKNAIYFYTTVSYANIDLTNNASFDAFAATAVTVAFFGMTYTPVKINLNKFTSTCNWMIIDCSKGYNASFGDLSLIHKKVTDLFYIMGGKNDGAIFGTITGDFKGTSMMLSYIDCVISANDLKILATKTGLSLVGMPNITGDISGCIFSSSYDTNYGIMLSELQNLFADVTTITFNNAWYTTKFTQLNFSYNPHFTGNLANLSLWSNKQVINLSYCAYTGIPSFFRKIFTNRNSCLKAGGGMTTISVQGNVDNASLTGTYQQPNLGTYTGNMNDLTEAQIDNLANGLNYTGTGTNTAWTDKEKIWFMVNCKNSSTDTSLRYRVTINY